LRSDLTADLLRFLNLDERGSSERLIIVRKASNNSLVKPGR
jgi:hypothetical protein